jgi:hypothetical protein
VTCHGLVIDVMFVEAPGNAINREENVQIKDILFL